MNAATTHAALIARNANLERQIAMRVADVRSYIPRDLMDAAEACRAEMVRAGLATYDNDEFRLVRAA